MPVLLPSILNFQSSIDGCEYVDDFLKEIKKESQLSIPPNTPLTLYQPDGTTVIDFEVNPSLLVGGNSRNNPLIVCSTLIEKGILIKEVLKSEGSPKRKVQPDTVDLHIYAPKATKKFETINLAIKSGKINVVSLLKEYRWKRLYFLEPKTLLQYDEHGWSLNDAFSGGNVYKFRYEIDDGYDESIGFSDAKIESGKAF